MIRSVLLAGMMVLVLQACKKKEDPFIDVPVYMQEAVPYKEGQQLRFRNEAGYIYNCKVEKVDYNWNRGGETVRVINYYLKEEGPKETRVVDVSFGSASSGKVYLSLIHNEVNNSSIGRGAELKVEPTGTLSCGSRSICHDTYTIDGRTETAVVELKVNDDFTVFYNKAKGVLQWKFDDGHSCTLIQ